MRGGRELSARLGVLRRTLRSRGLRRALVAYLVFNTTEWATWVALLVWAFGEGGATAAGLIAVAQLVPAALVAPLGSVLGDRMRRSRALALGYALQSLTLVTTAAVLALGAPFAAVACVAAFSASAITLTRPVHHAIVPDIARSPDELTAGNSASTTVEGVAGFLGPAFSGLMVAAWGPASVFAVMGVLSAGSAMLTANLVVRGTAVRSGRERMLASAVRGVREISRDAGAALLVAMVAAQYVVVGFLDILTVVLALEVLDTGDSGPGLLTSGIGVGAVLGGAASVSLVGRRRLAPGLAVAIVVTGVPVALLSLVGGPWLAGVLLCVYGAGKAFFDVAGRTLLQRTTKPEVLSRIFGIQEALMMAGIAVGSLLAPLAVAAFGSRGAFLVAGVFLPLVGLLAWVRIRRLDDRAVVPGPAYSTLAALPLLAPLTQRALEQLSWGALVVDEPADSVIIREGDAGDHFFVVMEGELSVSQAGRQIRRLGPGDGFGEIALLRATPRTATVVAQTAVRLAALDRDDFLLAVTGQPAIHSRAGGVVDEYLAGDDEARKSPDRAAED